jgi:anti-sigma regulatory factor (Ser/Thr protein kinase)
MSRQRWLTGQLDAALVGATSGWMQALGDEFGFSHDDLYRIQLCFEELVSNIVDYSDAQYAGQTVELRARIGERHASFALIDPAAPFDPLSRPPPVVASRIEDMAIGG